MFDFQIDIIANAIHTLHIHLTISIHGTGLK